METNIINTKVHQATSLKGCTRTLHQIKLKHSYSRNMLTLESLNQKTTKQAIAGTPRNKSEHRHKASNQSETTM